MKYLLDTDTCVFHLKGKFNIKEKCDAIGVENIFISEITVVELKFGVANVSEENAKGRNTEATAKFLDTFSYVPIIDTLDFYAEEKARLRKLGTPIQEFDLLIGSAAVVNDYIMVTNNEKHFNRIKGIRIENWTKM